MKGCDIVGAKPQNLFLKSKPGERTFSDGISLKFIDSPSDFLSQRILIFALPCPQVLRVPSDTQPLAFVS